MFPDYDLNKIKFATDGPTFEKAISLYENGKVTKFQKAMDEFLAVVLGTKPYQVFISARHYNRGACDCYLGQRDILCKHMAALAIYAVMRGEPLTDEDKKIVSGPMCSGRLGELNKEELAAVKKAITSAMRYIKAYAGPSRIWFAYQNSLDEGCNRLSAIVSELSVSRQTAKLLVDMLLQLDEKLCKGGVDDSDGTVGEFIYEVVLMLQEYAKLDKSCIKTFEKLCSRSTCFEWEKPLVEIFDKDNIN